MQARANQDTFRSVKCGTSSTLLASLWLLQAIHKTQLAVLHTAGAFQNDGLRNYKLRLTKSFLIFQILIGLIY